MLVLPSHGMTISLDPETGSPVWFSEVTPTTYQAAARSLPCPRCGTPVTIAPMNIDSFEAVGPNQWRPGKPIYNCRCYSTAVV